MYIDPGLRFSPSAKDWRKQHKARGSATGEWLVLGQLPMMGSRVVLGGPTSQSATGRSAQAMLR